MEIKSIKMSPKKGGNGYTSSYSINVGSVEAKRCGLIDDGTIKAVIKIVDPDKKRIIVKLKEYTLNAEIIDTVCEFARTTRALDEKMTRNTPGAISIGGFYAVDLGSIALTAFDRDNPDTIELRAHEKKFFEYLVSLPYETLTDLMTLMYMGRDGDADMTLPSNQRFVDYWLNLEHCGCFHEGREAIACQMMDKTPLPEYLQNGLRIFNADVRLATAEVEGAIDGHDEESDWY